MKALVVGATGNVGSKLVECLASRGHQVRGISRSKTEDPRENVEMVVGDVTDPTSLRAAAEGMDVVYHLVGYLFAPRRSQVESLNMTAARNVAETAIEAGVKRIVFTSSVLVYGPEAVMPTPEEHPRRPDTAYSRAKVAVEDYLLSLKSRGLDATIMRVGHVYGPGVSTVEEFKGLIRLGLYRTAGKKDHVIPPINADDLALALCLAGETPKAAGRIYNVNDDDPITLRQFSNLIAARLGKGPVKSSPVWVFKATAGLLEAVSRVSGRRPFFDLDTVTLMMEPHSGDNSRLKNELGWEPAYKSFKEGVDACFGDSGTPIVQ